MAWINTLFIIATLLMTAACRESSHSTTKTVDIANTQIKWQSIGNCWVYATAGWAESILLERTQKTYNFSESYLTYRHYQDQLMGRNATKIQTGGRWRDAVALVKNYGFVNEGDFIPDEAKDTFSERQKLATQFIEEKLAQKEFLETYHNSVGEEREAIVLNLLDEAFSVSINDLKPLIISAYDLIYEDEEGQTTNIGETINSWALYYNYSSFYRTGLELEDLPAMAEDGLSYTQRRLEYRVMRALNDGKPVILEWFVDFNALGSDGIFSLENMIGQEPDRQGYHQTVIEDYVVDAVGPNGEEIGEGEVSEELQTWAATHGRIKYLIVKNSWGGSERPSLSSYEIDGIKGFHRLDASYLYGWMKVKPSENSSREAETGLRGFILPQGY